MPLYNGVYLIYILLITSSRSEFCQEPGMHIDNI